MSSFDELCDYCARIPFDPKILASDGVFKYYLGPAARLESSQCPFCRLLLHACLQGRGEAKRNAELYISWNRGLSDRLAFTNPYGGDTWIGFSAQMGPQVGDEVTALETRRQYPIDPWTGPAVDTARILRWIYSCERMHGSACALPTGLAFTDAFRGLQVLRLLNVEANCLVETTGFNKYVALSYVWGDVSNFRLTKANRPALLEPGSLNRVSHLIPETIKDAITFTRRLGCRYLWVDALCMVQNDADDLEQGVNAMDLIYERAWLTVIASCGHNANAGLRGVQSGTRRPSQNAFQVIPGVEMGFLTGLDSLLKRSVYDSRAWTFQERVLSRRIIYFIDDKIFFRCRAAEHAEHFTDILSQNSEVGATIGSLLPEAILMTNPVFDFATMLFYYTKRALTSQNDAPRAMAGIIRRFTEAMKCQFFQGLPTALFDLFVVFHAHGTILHRRPSFPSYSWIGWRGSINVDLGSGTDNNYSTNDWLEKRTWIVWFKRSPSGITNLVWDLDANESFPSWDMDHDGYRNRRPFDNGRRLTGKQNTRRTMPTEEVSFSRTVPPYPILQFWTMSLFYGISDIDVFMATGYLADSNNNKCGCVWLDGFEETTFFESQGPFEVIILSESCSRPYTEAFEIHLQHPSSQRTGTTDWIYYYVLILEWQGGIAERRGFGYLHQSAVKSSLAPGPVWKEIFLA
ncbi:heterokaryon incompatibility protein-domain-containing protein [Ilyonectria sp. MPI-CAGE-AT-0026]|nr:heterokaryon incompatibility protein-domain-containing protein [Ilyonectria sp. MPI-CAGE-AT-0026]